MYFSTSASVYQYLVNEGKIKNCAVDFLGPGKWPFKNYSTWNDPDNSFYDLKTRTSYITDHMFLRTKSPEKIQAQTSLKSIYYNFCSEMYVICDRHANQSVLFNQSTTYLSSAVKMYVVLT